MLTIMQVVRNFIDAAVLHCKRERDLLLVEHSFSSSFLMLTYADVL
jgi:hypothetical protein